VVGGADVTATLFVVGGSVVTVGVGSVVCVSEDGSGSVVLVDVVVLV
jgi:hypothetical protein